MAFSVVMTPLVVPSMQVDSIADVHDDDGPSSARLPNEFDDGLSVATRFEFVERVKRKNRSAPPLVHMPLV